MGQGQTAIIDRLNDIFLGFSRRQQARAANGRVRFVYYTTADVAASILRAKEIWMRRSSTMNDFMEVRHGLACLKHAYHGSVGAEFRGVLDALFPGFCSDLVAQFDAALPHLLEGTFMTCFSEHRDDEDLIGRLSMWRAYGGSAGVALVMNNTAFLQASDLLQVYSSPVAYLDKEAFTSELREITDLMRKESDFLRSVGRDPVREVIFNMFRFAVLCSKHPGFREELEWRVVHTPAFGVSGRTSTVIETIRGIPQPIVKVPLRDYPEEGFTGAELPKLIDRVIIGPSQYPVASADAFCQLLREAGVADPEKKIIISEIPLRRS